MRSRALPDGTVVSAVGAGDVSLATAAARNIDSSEVTRALELALALGVTLVDIAAEDDAERLVGTLVRGLRLRDRIVVATRVPVEVDPFGVPKLEVPIAWTQQCVERSLRTTKLDVLPLVQLGLRPAWRLVRQWDELADTCERLVREGKVLHWGAYHVDDAVPARPLEPDEPPPPSPLDAPWIATRALPLSICESKVVLPTNQLAFARRPLAGGALAGTLGPGAKLAVRDDRLAVDDAMMVRYAVMAARLARFVKRVPPAARSCEAARAYLDQGARPDVVECETLAELSLRWVIDRGAIALPRLHRHEHVAEAVAAASATPLTQELS